jgi:hypothetical protein
LLQLTIKITPANTRITYFNTAIGCNKKVNYIENNK